MRIAHDHDLAATLTSLKRTGLAPSISCTAWLLAPSEQRASRASGLAKGSVRAKLVTSSKPRFAIGAPRKDRDESRARRLIHLAAARICSSNPVFRRGNPSLITEAVLGIDVKLPGPAQASPLSEWAS